MTEEQRAALDEKLRNTIREALRQAPVSPEPRTGLGGDASLVVFDEIVFLLTRLLPELTTRHAARGHLEAAFDLAGQS